MEDTPITVESVIKYYADYDLDGNIIGFYNSEIHGENIPETAVEITKDEWLQYISDPKPTKETTFVPHDPLKEQLEALKQENQMLGQQLVERELEALELKTENELLGNTIVDLDLRLLAGGL